MTLSFSSLRVRKPVIVATAAALLGSVLAAPTTASAKWFCSPGLCKPQIVLNKSWFGKPGFAHHHHGYGNAGWGYGAAALAGGLALGAMAAGAANAGSVEGACTIERRRAVDEDGNVFVRQVRVCE